VKKLQARGFIAHVINNCSWKHKNPETYDTELLLVQFEKYSQKCLIHCLSSTCKSGFFFKRRKCVVL